MAKNTTIKEIQLIHDLTSGVFTYTSNGTEGLDNYLLKTIKIKSTNSFKELVTISTVEKNVNFNTIMYKKQFTTGNNIIITADGELIFKEGTKIKIDITNISTIGNIYVTLYFDSI